MQLFKSIGNNFTLISYHIYTWLFKFFVLFMATMPLRNQMNAFFHNRTIGENMVQTQDMNALLEFILRGFYDSGNYSMAALIQLLVWTTVLFLIIDPLIEAGFVGSLHKKKKEAFWESLKSKGWKVIILKLILLIPNLLMIFVVLFSAFIIGAPNYTTFDMFIVIIFVGTFYLFMYKLNDLAKFQLVAMDRSMGDSISYAFNKVFSKFSDSLVINAITAVLFFIGYAIAEFTDINFDATTVGAVYMLTILQQLFVLLKQILRYSYLDAVMDLHTDKIETVEESTRPNADDGFEFNQMIKET